MAAAREAVAEESFDCVVAAYELGDGTGVELLETVRAGDSDLPFILYASQGDEKVASTAIAEGVTDYVVRNPDSGSKQVLLERVREALDEYEAVRGRGAEQERLNLLFDQSPFGVIEWNDSMECLRVNETAEDILGYSEADLRGESWTEIVPASEQESVGQMVEALLENEGGFKHVNENVRKDGERVHCEWHNRVLVEDGEVVSVISQFQDVTDRRRRQRRFEAVFDNTYTFIGLMDTDGTLLEVNDTALAFAGVDREQVVGKPIWETYSFQIEPETQRTVKEGVERARDGELFRDEYRVQGEDRDAIIDFSIRPVRDDDGEVQFLVPEGRDITDRKERERKLEQSERRYRNLVENSPAPINLFDGTGETVWGNDAVLDLLGLSDLDDLVGRSIFEFIHEDDEPVAEGEIDDIFGSESAVGPTNFRLERADGDVRHVQVQTTTGWFEGEQVGQAVVVDLTELREKEAELRRSENRYRTLVEMSPHSILVHTDGEILYANESFAHQVGVGAADDVVGTSVLEYVPASDEETVLEQARATERGNRLPTNRRREIRTVTGETRYVTTTSRPVVYEDETAVLTVLNDRTQAHRYQSAVRSLHENTRDMFRADDTESIAAVATAAVGDLLDIADGVVYEYDESRNALCPIAATAPEVDVAGEEGAVGPADDHVAWEAFASDSRRHVPRGDGVGAVDAVAGELEDPGGVDAAPVGVDESSTGLFIPLGEHGVFRATAEGPDGLSHTEIELCSILAANLEAAFEGVQREVALREREQRLERQTDTLEAMERLNGIIRDITRSMYDVTTQEAVRDAVCTRLGNREEYSAVWVGERADDGESFVAASTAGSMGGLLDAVEDDAVGAPLQSLLETAVESNAVQVVDQVVGTDAWRPMRETALQHGFQSVAAVPIPLENEPDEVLVVHASAANSFTPDQREVFGELGHLIGSAMGRLGVTTPQLPGRRTELDVEISDPGLVWNRIAAELEGEVVLRGAMPSGSGSHVAYVQAEESAAAVRSLPAALHVVRSAAVLAEDEGSGLYQCTVSESPFFELLSEYGAALEAMETTGGGTAVTVRVASSTSVRGFVEALSERFSGVELAARRSDVSAVETPVAIRERVREGCTDRQYQALQAAFYGGYYEWPRSATNEDLAEVLSIASSTYQSHRRTGERVVMSLLFDGVN
ncbi:PAS domain S-box protein [Halorubellus litoreus]|uniref:PAS domain S-box protein n=1 Tax=Halorubellus litoreus TaxID=755308 RepID=A0ABD5VP30_9EURY